MILETAKVVLLPNPEATLDDVAEAAGVTRQLVSLYFPGGGTGPLYGAMFDEYIAALPTILGEDLLKVGTDPKRFRAATAEVVARVLDWAESVGEPWVFGDGGDHPGALIAERWKALNKVTVEMLLGVLGDVFGTPQHPARVSNAILAELNATAAVARTLLEGEIQRADAEAVINERFVALYTVVIPALES
ncbi:MAG: TetR/AcrR family transcriptional regulator [Solirubrobacterales bacterium]|nr:TetR/AcrR family transcriptional regulator [Solirubrobacterales bacterium]